MSAVEEGQHRLGNGPFTSRLHNDEEYVGEHNEEEEEEEEEEDEEEEEEDRQTGAAAHEGASTGTASASTTPCSSKVFQPKKPSLHAIPFPLARVKRLIKNEDDTRVSSEATYVIAKGVGLFLEKFVEHSFEHMINDRRHSLTYKDLATHVSQAKRFHFLADFVPQKVTAACALNYRLKEEE